MRVDQDIVPSTVRQAVELIVASLSEDERRSVLDSDAGALHHGVGAGIRNAWSLWHRDTPLKRDAVSKYGIAHPDDISGLILAWASALVRNDAFDPVEHCKRYHAHWKAMGSDALSAGGWPPPEEW